VSKAISVLAFSGSDHLRRKRLVRKTVRAFEEKGWSSSRVDATAPGRFRAVMSGSVFRAGKLVVVIDNPNKVDVKLWQPYVDHPDSSLVLVLNYVGKVRGNTKFGKFLKALPKGRWREHNMPTSPWKVEEAAEAFCVQEAKNHGLTLDPKLAKSIVLYSGTNLELLALEVLKVATLTSHFGEVRISPSHIGGGLSGIGGSHFGALVDGLSARHGRKVAQSLARIRAGSKSDPTIQVARFLWATVSKWLSVANLLAQGTLAEDVASELDLNGWYCQSKLMPPAKRWGQQDLIALLSALSEGERGVLRGAADPWIYLSCRVLKVI